MPPNYENRGRKNDYDKGESDENKIDLTKEEIEALKQMAATWKGLENFGKVASVFRSIMVYIAWAIAFYLAIKHGIVDWIKGIKL
jgi:hypothetical protein